MILRISTVITILTMAITKISTTIMRKTIVFLQINIKQLILIAELNTKTVKNYVNFSNKFNLNNDSDNINFDNGVNILIIHLTMKIM